MAPFLLPYDLALTRVMTNKLVSKKASDLNAFLRAAR